MRLFRDKGLNSKKGRLTVTDWTEEELKANPPRRGFVTVNDSAERNGRYFTYSDGTPCFWIARYLVGLDEQQYQV